MFENLLAAYNPETSVNGTESGQVLITPRAPIVDYMVDEALVASAGGTGAANGERCRVVEGPIALSARLCTGVR